MQRASRLSLSSIFPELNTTQHKNKENYLKNLLFEQSENEYIHIHNIKFNAVYNTYGARPVWFLVSF